MGWESLERRGVASAAELRPHRNRVARLVREGRLIRVLPGVYALPERANEPLVRVRAVQLAWRRLVIIGDAARCVYGDKVRLGQVSVAHRGGWRPPPGVRVHGIRVPEVIEVEGVRVPDAAWNAAWLAPYDNGAGIDAYLHGGGRLEAIRTACDQLRHSPHQVLRRRVVDDSRDLPWSQGERELHRLLRRLGITHWSTNVRLVCASGFAAVVDCVLWDERIVIEFDGWEFHHDRTAFELDRQRQAELVADGWRVLRFTWRQVVEQPDWTLAVLRRAVASSVPVPHRVARTEARGDAA